MSETVAELAVEDDLLENMTEIVWVGGDMTSDHSPIRLPLGTKLIVLRVWRKGQHSRVLLQIVDYLDEERRKFYRRRRLPEFAAGSWGAKCFKKY